MEVLAGLKEGREKERRGSLAAVPPFSTSSSGVYILRACLVSRSSATNRLRVSPP